MIPGAVSSQQLRNVFGSMLDIARNSGPTTKDLRLTALMYIGAEIFRQGRQFSSEAPRGDEEKAFSTISYRLEEVLSKEEIESFERPFSQITAEMLRSWESLVRRPFTETVRGSQTAEIGEWFSNALDDPDNWPTGGVVTPSAVARLMAQLIGQSHSSKVLDPYCGTAGLLAATAIRLQTSRPRTAWEIVGFERNPLKRSLAKLRLHLLGISNFRILPFEILDHRYMQNVDAIVCMPPAGLQLLDVEFKYLGFKYTSSESKRIAADTALLSSALELLRPGGRAVFLVPTGVLFRTGSDRDLRERMVRSGCLKSVTLLPDRLLLPMTAIRSTLVLLEKPGVLAPSQNVELFDASRLGARGRQGTTFSTQDVENLYQAISGQSGTKEISQASVNSERILKGEVSLLPSKYIHIRSSEKDILNEMQDGLHEMENLEAARMSITFEVDRLIRHIIFDRLKGLS